MNVPGAECRGQVKVSYAWAPLANASGKNILHDVLSESEIIEAYDQAEAYEQELFLAFSNESESMSRSLLSSSNPAVKITSTYISENGEDLIIRLLNVTDEACQSKVFLDLNFHHAHLCRLDEEVGEEVFLYHAFEPEPDDKESAENQDQKRCALEVSFQANELKTIKLGLSGITQEKAAKATRTASIRKKRATKTSKNKTG